jgi:hypothetical protein
MTLHQQGNAIRAAAKNSYEFIEVCRRKGLCTFDEAKKAMQTVHEDCMNDIDDLYNPQFMLDKQLESQEAYE